MAKPTEEMFDKRVVDRNLQQGLISQADQDKYLAKLPDVEDNAEWVEIDAVADAKADSEQE